MNTGDQASHKKLPEVTRPVPGGVPQCVTQRVKYGPIATAIGAVLGAVAGTEPRTVGPLPGGAPVRIAVVVGVTLLVLVVTRWRYRVALRRFGAVTPDAKALLAEEQADDLFGEMSTDLAEKREDES